LTDIDRAAALLRAPFLKQDVILAAVESLGTRCWIFRSCRCARQATHSDEARLAVSGFAPCGMR
jgi:hypothetical protein